LSISRPPALKADLPRVHPSKTHPLWSGPLGHPHANIGLIKNHLIEEKKIKLSHQLDGSAETHGTSALNNTVLY